MHQAQKQSLAPISTARPVARKQTMVGGFEIDTGSMPARQSGATSAGGVVASQADDPKAEAAAEALALIARLAEIVQDVNDGRPIQASESLRAARRQIDNLDGYVQHLARRHATPLACPRCQARATHDPAGLTFCDGCVSASFGKVRF